MKSQGDIDIKFNPRLLKLCKNRPIFFQNSQTCRSRQIFIFKNPGRIDTKLNSGDLNFSLQNESRYRLEKWCAFVEMLFLHKKKFTNICDYRERYIKFKKNSINSTHLKFLLEIVKKYLHRIQNTFLQALQKYPEFFSRFTSLQKLQNLHVNESGA